MRIEYFTKNYELKDRLKEIIERKIERLNKFFLGEIKLKIALKKVGASEIMELTISLDGMVMRSEVASNNMYENIDSALPKLEKQIIKHRKRLSDKSKKVSLTELEQEMVPELHDEDIHKVVKTKKFPLIPMSIDDAIEEMELTDHAFYVFLNKASKSVCVLYTRHDGDYGLIETVK
ncbi:MAG: ribosome-associated translation inhibitor RaiA [Firmicutes bacterium]|nr:ribosome-associated translation inhibitor RaiA [Bacillota bacterium]